MSSTNYKNSLYSDITRWFNKMCSQHEERVSFLQAGLANGLMLPSIKHAGRYAGRKPGFHIETGLKDRVIKAGLGHYIRDFEKISHEAFDSSLERAESIMMNQGKYQLDKRKLLRATLLVRKKCKFPKDKFVPATPEETDLQINRTSSASFPYYKRKGKVFRHMKRKALACYKDKELRDVIFNFPQTRGFRLQLREEDRNIVRKIRVMYPYPGSIIYLEDMFIIPFVRHFIDTNTFYVIGRSGQKISNLLKYHFDKCSSITSLDVSHFDQSVINEVIICAFWILRSQLRLTSSEHQIFEKIVQYFMSSVMVSKSKGKEPYAFLKTHGIPSGSGFTNMIGTLVHAIIVAYLQPDLLDNEKCLLCADDNIFDSRNIDLAKLSSNYLRVFDMTVNLTKTKVSTNPKKLSFLGFSWINYIRVIDPLLAINQLLWHTDFLVDLDRYERELARGASVLLNGQNGHVYFAKIFPDVIRDLYRGYDIRFRYLFGTQPLPRVDNATPSNNLSLLLHLKEGWSIR